MAVQHLQDRAIVAEPVVPRAAPAQRLVSLDVFRGLTMAAMVIVNNPGDGAHVYWPLDHAPWNGWTPTDLIFPFFLFIVGITTTLSKKSTSWGSITRRGWAIILIGWFLAAYPHFVFAHLRFPGVLPRIGVCYLMAASLYKLTAGDRRRQGLLMIAGAAVLCVAYWLWMTMVPTPAGIRGDLSPSGNWGAYVDRAVFGTPHMWSQSKTWDPEGILSTIPALATTLLGIAAGLWLGAPATLRKKIRGLAIAGVVGIAIGYAWNPFFPINKNLWTSSFVFFTAGAACVLLAACSWLIDVRGVRGWTKPWVVLGTNAITLFAASALLVKTLLWIKVSDGAGGRESFWHYSYVHAFQPFADPYIASLAFALANLVVLYALLAWMYRRRLFLRV
ncbi:MAG: acyltransferase family protein [Vicinamibacterales bacterium]